MIQKFVDRFMTHDFDFSDVDTYEAIVKLVVEAIADADDWDTPSPDCIHVIDDGHFQGTLIFVIGAKGYQPYAYWYVKVDYGSCSTCDTLQAALTRNNRDKDLWTLALHIVQGIKEM